MTDICLNMVTKANVHSGLNALRNIWSLDNWVNSLDRVKYVTKVNDSSTFQHLKMGFDANRESLDHIEVERNLSAYSVDVRHIVPPPNVVSLTARWWIEEDNMNTLYARRKIIINEKDYSIELAYSMFDILKSNMQKLLRDI